MNKQETTAIMGILKASYPSYYKDMSRKDADGIIHLWADLLSEEPAPLVAAAVKEYIAHDTRGFPPAIGAIKGAVYDLTHPAPMSEDEAMERIMQAVSNGYYGAQEEYAKLPPILQQTIGGSPAPLARWATMNVEELQSVVFSHLRRTYRELVRRQREYDLMPADVKRLVGGMAGDAPALPPTV